MRQLDLRVTDYYPQKALFASKGNSIVGQETGFSRRDTTQGFEWTFALEQSHTPEGIVKFFTVLLTAFVVHERVVVTIADVRFCNREALQTYADSEIASRFSINDRIEAQVYREGEGIQFH